MNEKEQYEYKVYWSTEDQAYIGKVAEFPSLAVHGDTPQDALQEIQFVVKEVVQELKKRKEPIPQPLSLQAYSGKLNLRMPPYLHRELVSEAHWQKVSLNQLIVSKLAKGLSEH